MKRWILKHDVTDIDGLALEETAIPEPGPNQVRIRVEAISLNARDLMVIAGPFGRMPGEDIVPASDMAGIVDAIGTGVTDWTVGDRVVNLHFKGWHTGAPPADAGMGLGALNENGVLSEYVVLDAARIARTPTSLTATEAACLPCAAVTAWNALFGDHPVAAKQRVMITGSGGVALFAMQLALAAEASVSAISGSASSRRHLSALGVEPVIDRIASPDWGQAVFDATGGIDKVIDTIGIGTANQSLTALKYGGEVATVGLMDMDGPPIGFSLFGKSLRGIMVGSGAMYEDLSSFIDKHSLKPIIGERFELEHAQEALRTLATSSTFGKIVVEP